MKKLLFLIPLLSLFALNAYAHNCGGEFQPETGTCRVIGPDGRMIMYNSDPPQSGSSQGSAPTKIIQHIIVNGPSKYGAIAHSPKTGGGGDHLTKTL